MHEFKMPSLGADMESGTLIQWLIKPGDKVKRGDVVAVVDTDKAAVEMEIWENGTFEKILVGPGQKVPVGTPLALISEEPAVPQSQEQPAAAPPPSSPLISPTLPHSIEKESAGPARADRVKASPAARRRALELGIDLDHVQGTGADKAITLTDVEKADFSQPATVSPTVAPMIAPMVAMRRAIAASMARSKREIPHYYLATEIDMSATLAWLEKENLARPIVERLIYACLLIKSTALAVRDVPEMNGFWVEGAFRASESVHPGIAISLRQGGLVAPALHDADKKTVSEIMADLMTMTQRARTGILRSSEMSDATITITNLGDQGVDMAFGVIYPPQVAIVSFGRVRPNKTLTATLSADHRVSDGHRGGVFLSAINRLLQDPATL